MVIKRNGDKVDFDENKIIIAILKANKDVALDEALSESTIREIADNIREVYELTGANMSVEEIQDLVEQYIMIYHGYEVARAYIKYRYKRELARNQYKDLMDAIDEKLNATNVQNQNANVDEKSFGGRIGEAANLLMKKFALENCISEKSVNNHINNEIYIHDLDHYAIGSHNCLSIPFDDLLKKGFNTRQTDIRPANSINTAIQLVAVIFQLQSLQQFGGVSATHLDWTMVPYVRKSFYKYYKKGIKYLEGKEIDYSFHDGLSIEEEDYKAYSKKAYEYAMEMTIKEIEQAVEGMYHNLNY